MGLLALLAYSYSIGSVKDCSNGLSKMRVNSMSFLPDPAVKGQNSTLALSLDNPSEVLAGTATYSFTYNFIPLAPEVKDLCGEVPGGCPIKVGILDTTSSYLIDPSLSGTLVLKIQWKDKVNTELLCISVSMKV
jgi:hypothetical protein